MQKILEEAWRNYAEKGMSVNTPIMMRAIMRRQFYIGAQACFVGMFTKMKDDDTGQSIDAEVIASIQKEIMDFLAETPVGPLPDKVPTAAIIKAEG